MNYVDRLVEALRQQLRLPWRPNTSGAERTWFMVVEPDKLRSVMTRKPEFEMAVQAVGKSWIEIDVTADFGAWMAEHKYKERYFQRPALATTIESDFALHMTSNLQRKMTDLGADDQTVVALTGVEALYGINRLSQITRMVEDDLPGVLLVFFPGEYQAGQYRFLDARDGWNYLAVPILPVVGKGSL